MFLEFIINVLNFKPTRADSDVSMQKNFRNGGNPYYEYLLVYVDDVLVVSHAPEEVMKQIGSEFEIKNGEYGPPTSYLGAEVSKIQYRVCVCVVCESFCQIPSRTGCDPRWISFLRNCLI